MRRRPACGGRDSANDEEMQVVGLRRSEHTEYLPGVYDLRKRRQDWCRAMSAACEDFGTALWDIPMEITGKTGPGPNATARRLARRLLVRGWVTMIEEHASGPGLALGPAEALAVLDRPEPWTAPGVMFSLIATEPGQDAYWRHTARRPHHRVGFNY